MEGSHAMSVEGGVTIRIRVKPRASRSQVLGVRDGHLEVQVAAPPVDGEANAELVRTLAKHFGVARGRVSLEAGDASRVKRVRIEAVSLAEILAATP